MPHFAHFSCSGESDPYVLFAFKIVSLPVPTRLDTRTFLQLPDPSCPEVKNYYLSGPARKTPSMPRPPHLINTIPCPVEMLETLGHWQRKLTQDPVNNYQLHIFEESKFAKNSFVTPAEVFAIFVMFCSTLHIFTITLPCSALQKERLPCPSLKGSPPLKCFY